MKDILREIGTISRSITTIDEKEFKSLNLSKSQNLYLVRIFEHPGIIQEKLAEVLSVERSTTAKSVKKLVEYGFIEKRKEEDNKKEFKLYCTEKGKEIYEILRKNEEYLTQLTTEGLNEIEKEELLSLLIKMRKNTRKLWEETIKKGEKIGWK